MKIVGFSRAGANSFKILQNWPTGPRTPERGGPTGPRTLERGSAVTEARGALGPNILIDPHRACWHAMRFRGGGRDFRSLHFTYLLDGCLYDDDLPIANLEPGVSGRNSLPLSALRALGPCGLIAFWSLQFVTLNFASILGSILDLILDQNSLIFQCLFALILKHRFLYDFEGIFVICL